MTRAMLVISIAVTSTVAVLIATVWTGMGVWAKWRRGAMRWPKGRAALPDATTGERSWWQFWSVLFITGVALSACTHEPVSAEFGRALYRQNGCGSCHGADGRGDGPVASTLDPRPTDLRARRTFKRGADEGAVADMLAVGIPFNTPTQAMPPQPGHNHNQGMPPYGHLTLAERRSLAKFILTLDERTSQ